MALSRPETSKLFARDIAAYSDAELDQYLEANGGHVQVEDWAILMKDEVLMQRFRERAFAGDAVRSRQIDLNCVSARLEGVSTDKDPLLQRFPSVSSTAGSSIDEEKVYRLRLERETEYYNSLINVGGRPSHPISLGNDATKLEVYREILSFWNPYSSDESGWMVFEAQLCTWNHFCEMQRRMRTDDALEMGSVFPARPAEPGRFAAYCRRLHKRLARHGFERSFQLNEDPDQQDKLMTWIEYLNYQYVQYDKHANIMKRLQRQHDEAWKKLVESKVLKPSETEESIWTFGIGFQMEREEIEAKKAVESAKNVLLKAQSAGLSGRSLSQVEQKLSSARSKLAAAAESLEWASRRYSLIVDFHYQTKPYKIAKSDAAHQSILLRWILQQVPLIELELNPTKVSENSRRQRSLKRNRVKEGNEEPPSKRQRQDGEDHTLLENKTRASNVQETSSTQQLRKTRSSRNNPIDLPKRPCSQQAPRASRSSNTKSDAAKSSVVLDHNARVKNGRRCNKFSLNKTPDSRVLRQSSRLKRPPERFQ